MEGFARDLLFFVWRGCFDVAVVCWIFFLCTLVDVEIVLSELFQVLLCLLSLLELLFGVFCLVWFRYSVGVVAVLNLLSCACSQGVF